MITVRPMTADDLDAVLRIERDSFSVPWSESAFRASLANSDQHFFCAETGGEIAGFCGYWQIGDEADLLNIAVSPSHRRRGIGDLLMQTLLSHAQAGGVAVMHLEVRAANEPALALYRRHRFGQDGLRPHYYSHPTEDAVLMSRSIPKEG